ncbi:hypothetical protein HNQ07_002163 [Deinococcus metalli]|uniref:Uncharacterized protein n=1 Tax=Deinococcus metalli TaxID=1141878 RepID=A0A7W8NNA5_9DEIO|nr:hypothetical protein [Deinococcus metalli]MBB5376699.1 hypothetical protein [Deinococcus metalli]GHF65806.1 hypothetical protein GCM10017781_46910 [Deinococcus metalli]
MDMNLLHFQMALRPLDARRVMLISSKDASAPQLSRRDGCLFGHATSRNLARLRDHS